VTVPTADAEHIAVLRFLVPIDIGRRYDGGCLAPAVGHVMAFFPIRVREHMTFSVHDTFSGHRQCETFVFLPA
jgi:hypothetical protein